MATAPILTHKRLAVTHDQHIKTILGTPVSTAVVVTAHTVFQPVFKTVVTANISNAGWGVQVFSYSYDGILHTESYRSDI